MKIEFTISTQNLGTAPNDVTSHLLKPVTVFSGAAVAQYSDKAMGWTTGVPF
jgi:hypothetical protein